MFSPWQHHHREVGADTLYPVIITGLIGLIAAYIAYRQYVVARRKLNLDLFDRRLKVFEGLMEFLKTVVGAAAVTPEDLQAFVVSRATARFLFGQDVIDYLTTIHEKAVRFRLTNSQIAAGPPPLTAVINENADLLNWLAQQLEGAAAMFEPYLSFATVKGGAA